MTDRREQILARLLVLAKALPGVKSAERNKDEIPESQRPAVQIFDADEQRAEGTDARSHRAGASQLMTMSPQILILLGGTPATVGSDLNAIRKALLKAALFDDVDGGLIDLTGAGSKTREPRGGAIRYLDCATSLGHGRSMEGAMGVNIEFTYPLIFSEL